MQAPADTDWLEHTMPASSHALPAAFSVRTRGLFAQLAFAALGVLALTLSAKVQVPFYPVPVTMQTLVVLLIGAFAGMRLGVATVAAYIGLGLMGWPVFANTPPVVAGPLYLLGPTGGFIIGFLVSAAIAGYAVERFGPRKVGLVLGAMLLGQALLFTIGWLWLGLFAKLASGATGVGLGRAFSLAVAPFAVGDVLKAVIAALMVRAAAGR
jgi:biotin transport system substrate-specific component